jgi:hypothetical protein
MKYSIIYFAVFFSIVVIITAMVLNGRQEAARAGEEGRSMLISENLPKGVTKFRDGKVNCYIYRQGYGAGINCIPDEESL